MSKSLLPYFLVSIPIVGFYLLCTANGMLLSPDSRFYLYIAEHFVETGAFRTPGGNVVTYWPPLFILALTPVTFFESYPFYLHLFLLIVHQVLLLKMAKRHLDGVDFLLFCALAGLSTLTLMVSVYVWSELLFMIFLLLSLLKLEKWQESFRLRELVLFALALCSAMLTRNAGVFLSVPLVIYGLFQFTNKRQWMLIGAIVFATLSNILWNWGRGIFTEKRHVFTELFPNWSPIRNLLLTTGELGYNFFPRFIPEWLVSILMITLLVLISRHFIKGNLAVTIALGYLLFWIFIPSDAANIGRFIAPVWSFILLGTLMLLRRYCNNLPKAIFWLSASYLLTFSLIRISINAMTWAQIKF